MFSALTPTDVAFVMAGLMQAVVAALWVVGGRVIGDTQRVTLNWAISGACGALSFAFYVGAWRAHGTPVGAALRAVGNVGGVLSLIALQRGVWLFMNRPIRYAVHLLALAVMLPGAWYGMAEANTVLRIEIWTLVQAALGLAISLDLYVCGRDTLQMRRPWLLPLPVWVFCATTAARGMQAALISPVALTELTGDSSLNVGSAFAYVLLLLPFHATLLTLVVTRLRADLQRLSHHDGLTGLLNRRALEESLTAQVQRSRRNGECFCVLMLDADHFKRINDRFGHAVGDAALKHMAALLVGRLRKVDRVARFGGEEFLVLLPGLVLRDALPVAERLRAAVAGSPLLHAGASIPMSVSIGIAEWGGAQEDCSRLLVRADAALYQAKHLGRDQVATAQPDALMAA